MPVIHIVDKAMANSDQTYPMFDPSLVKIDRGALIRGGSQARRERGVQEVQADRDRGSPRGRR